MNSMKNLLLFTLTVMFLASCAPQKYAYHFDTYDYNSGRKAAIVKDEPVGVPIPPPNETILTADVKAVPVLTPGTRSTQNLEESKRVVAKKYSEMSKAERKEFRRDTKTEIKKLMKAVRKGEGVEGNAEAKVMDNDLKLAIIFGAVGLTLTLFGGINEAFWILGVISIVVGVVFLIKWLVRQ
jgi:hypothetical protein